MPIVIQCPTCNRQLRVPDDLLGQPVRCPSCKAMFTASTGGGSAPMAGTSQEAEEPRRSRPADSARPAAEEEEGRPVRHRPKPPRYDDDFDDRPAEYADEEGGDFEPAERGRSPRRRSTARNAVAAPAICLMVIAGIGFAYYLFNTVAVALFGLDAVPFVHKSRNHAERTVQLVGVIAVSAFIMCWWVAVFVGALNMKRLRGHGFAVASSIMAMVPCGGLCCLLGIPFGIWSLVVLNRPDVKDAF